MNSGEDNKRMNAGLVNALGGNATPAPTPMLDSIQRNQQAALTSNERSKEDLERDEFQASSDREHAIRLACKHAKLKPQSYYAEPFQPHEWVIDAIVEALNE